MGMEQFLEQGSWAVWVAIVWTLVWKGFSLWKAGRREHKGWFIALLVLNTLGVLDAIYIFIVSDWMEKRKGKKGKRN